MIDDCQDSDVPLLELVMGNLFLVKDLQTRSGQAQCSFSIDYYNRILSGWEPFLEPWRLGKDSEKAEKRKFIHLFIYVFFCSLLARRCAVSWTNTTGMDLSPKRLIFNLSAEDVMNMNITRSLIDQFTNVKEVWTQDFYNPKERLVLSSLKKYTLYILCNECFLWFFVRRAEPESSKQSVHSGYRRRSPFVPFALKNETGCMLSMSTSVAAGNK